MLLQSPRGLIGNSHRFIGGFGGNMFASPVRDDRESIFSRPSRTPEALSPNPPMKSVGYCHPVPAGRNPSVRFLLGAYGGRPRATLDLSRKFDHWIIC